MVDKAMASEIIKACKEFVSLRVGELVDRIKLLEDRPPAKDGVDGAPGKDGADGAPGERGPEGLAGANGFRGEPGASGKDGADGLQGPAGADGVPGLRGENGADGRDGRDGKDGEPGRDALEIDIIPMIEDGKRYRRGAFAVHNGGLWRADRNTESMDDWTCIVRGVASVEIEYADDGRTVTEKHFLSDGSHVSHVRYIPIMIYRGVWTEGALYTKGDTVTFGGSLWHCDEANGARPTDGVQGWTLATKRGRDGKPGLEGKQGPAGSDGRPGRDLTQMHFNGAKS